MNNTGNTILSILIPSIPKRKHKLDRLLAILNAQINQVSEHETLGIVEVVVDDSPSFLDGGLSIGKKRQSLVSKANGKYLCFLDDDESIAPNYTETLLRLCNFDLDVCTFRSIIKLDSAWGLVDMRLFYKENDQFSPEYTMRRPPWHICPVRREFASLYEFDDINNAEDYIWFEKVLTHCTTEAHTDKILFQYNHGKHSEADLITNTITE
jgi:glycosyltransferase involved in cell wall biosynthesis